MPPEWAAELADCFSRLASQVYDRAYFITRGEQALAEDLVQEAFQAAARNWGKLRTLSPEEQAGWLCRVAVNIAINGFRRNRTARDKQSLVWQRYQPREADTHVQALSAIALQRCWEVIQRLPERQHLVALLRWGYGMKSREIAEVLGISEGAVTSQVTAARKKLLLELGSDMPFEPGGPEGGA
jgi:RNA polymerase sigma factor (sigma-70 family)